MSEKTIVRKIPEAGKQETFGKPELVKVKQGEQMIFNAHVNVEGMPEGKFLKKATIFSNVPNGGTWEILSDEGTAVGGRGSAPSPIMYFATGLALCMMSHVEMLAQQLRLRIRARLEQRASFSTTMNLGGIHPKDVFGRAERVDMHLLIDSDVPEEAAQLEAFVGWCRQACMSLQAVVNETPVTLALRVNGANLTELPADSSKAAGP
jgi:uncharacterized OsmC-like protein